MEVTINSAYSSPQQITATSQEENKQVSAANTSAESKTLPDDKVNISEEALRKLAKTEESKTAENTSEDKTEQLIEALKEKIAELNERLAKLRTKDDEASIEQTKVLEIELATLNAQLMELVTSKLAAAKA